jgi:hypothetical protein
MKNIQIYSDGSVEVITPAPVTDMHFAIVRMLPNPNQTYANEVMAAAVNDQDIPTRLMKGDKIPCRQWFNFMSMIMTAPALRWALEPHVLFINDRYKGDSAWPETDPQGNAPSDAEPICESIFYPCNFVAWDYKIGEWYHLLAYDYMSPPTNAQTDNWFTKPYLWGKAQARNIVDDHLSNPGNSLDVYLPLLRQYRHVWMHATQLEIFPALPFILNDGQVVVSYQVQGADVIGQTQAGTFLYLRKCGKFTGTSEPYSNWHLAQRGVIPPTVRS